MAKKTLDIEKVKEAIKTLEEARELLDEVDKVLPNKQVIHVSPWRAWPVYPYYPHYESRCDYTVSRDSTMSITTTN